MKSGAPRPRARGPSAPSGNLSGPAGHLGIVSASSPPSANPPGFADAALIRRFLAGDEGAFRTLYQRHTPRLRMIVLRLLGPRRSEVDDVMQETWLAGCRGIHRYNGDAQFASWLTTIGIRTAYRRFNGQERARVSETPACLGRRFC